MTGAVVEAVDGGTALTVRSLTAGYGRKTILHGVDLGPLPAGEVTALVGPNAAGKSTLLRALAGLLPIQGSVRLFDQELVRMPPPRRAAVVSFMPQSLPERVGLSVLEGVLSSLHATPIEGIGKDTIRGRALAALSRVGIADLALARLDRLSGGQRQLASLAQAIARDPRLLLLDEPTSALDLRFQVIVMDLLRAIAREGRVVVVVLHDLNLALRWADRIVVLSEGRVRSSGSGEDAVSPELLRDVYGVESRVERCSRGNLLVLVDRAGEDLDRAGEERGEG